MHKKIITVSVISELTVDQRVIRICTTLQEMGFDVRVIARQLKDSLPLGTYPFQATRIKCRFRNGFWQFAEFNLKLSFKLLFRKTDYFLSNDLDTLLPNYIIAGIRRKRLFYDTHEYYTGVSDLKDAHFKRKVWKFFEDWIFPGLKVVYTVNNSVRDQYQKEYGNQIAVVRNVPVTKKAEPIPLPDHWQGKIILLMQGMGMHPGRGGLELLEVMKYLPGNFHLVYIGSGAEWPMIEKKRLEWQLADRVEMIPKLPPEELRRYTPLAHLGFCLDGFEHFNYLYSLPNRLFDYLHAGVPVVATRLPEVAAIIEQYECGICLNDQDPEKIAKEIISLMSTGSHYQLLKQNAALAAKELCWENEQHKLIAIYEPYLS